VYEHEGAFFDGNIEGISRVTWVNGTYFEGPFEKGLAKGEGRLTWYNGNYHEGSWAGSKATGYGKRVIFDSGRVFEGNWKWMKTEGIEEMNNIVEQSYLFEGNNGDVFTGLWVDGNIEGKGVYKWNNGDVYDGKWVNGKKEGYGELVSWGKKKVLKGNWKNDALIEVLQESDESENVVYLSNSKI